MLVFVIYKTNQALSAKEKIYSNLQHLPNPPLFSLDSIPFTIRDANSTVLIYFNPDCSYCEQEAEEIAKNIADFRKTELIFISSDIISRIALFATNFNLDHKPNVSFTKINPDQLFDNFGTVSTPHIFIYGSDKRLIKQFKGKTDLKKILQVVNQ